MMTIPTNQVRIADEWRYTDPALAVDAVMTPQEIAATIARDYPDRIDWVDELILADALQRPSLMLWDAMLKSRDLTHLAVSR